MKLNQTTIGKKLHMEVDADPTITSTPATIASIALFDDAGTGKMFLKSGALDTSWTELGKTTVPLTSTTVTVPKNNDTDWADAGLVAGDFQGFGTPTAIQIETRREGGDLLVRGKFTSGTSTAVEARINLKLAGVALTSAGVTSIPSIQKVGDFAYSVVAAVSGQTLIETSVGYLTMGFQSGTVGGLNKANGSTIASSGNIMSFTARIPIQDWSANETETKTIPLTSAVLVTQPDSMIRLNTVNGYGSTNTVIRRFTNVSENIGSDILYLDSPTLGASFTALTSGYYSVSYSDNFNAQSNVGLSLNSTQLSTDITSIPVTERLGYDTTSTTNLSSSVSWQGYLNSGDIIRAHCTGVPTGIASRTSFTMSKVGSTKIVNPSSDQKIDIPTHSLRFEGASTRGSTDTAVVKFDTLANIRGDGFEVVNTVANGTVVTMKKAGTLSMSASLYGTANQLFTVTKNKTTLTAMGSSSSENLATGSLNSTTGYATASVTAIPVVPGDKIRVVASANPTADTVNNFTLFLQENSVAVALSNVLPQWSEGDSSVRLNTANGYGSTATKIRRFSNIADNLGSAITYTDSPTLGASFVANEDGIYEISYTDSAATSTYFGLSKNASSLTASISATPVSERLAIEYLDTSTAASSVAWSGYLSKNDVVRPHADGAAAGTNAFSIFTISKVGKPNVTVDVTPFVNIKTQDVQAIRLRGLSGLGSTNTKVVRYNNIDQNTNTGIIRYTQSVTLGDSFEVLKSCTITINASVGDSGGTGSQTYISLNATDFTSPPSTAPAAQFVASSQFDGASGAQKQNQVSTSLRLNAGDIVRIHAEGDASTDLTRSYLTLVATAASDSIVTPTQQISSDTLPFTFKSTAIVDADPIGTFNTYTYAANTNTATISASAPIQTVASMNANGFQVFARAYNATSTTAIPARVDIKIGKGLKATQVNAYASAAKTSAFPFDRVCNGSLSDYGTDVFYSETSGVLTINAGVNTTGAITVRSVDSTQMLLTNGYFVFNASTSPSITALPALQPRIAYVKDIKTTGTAGGVCVAGVQTRNLNDLVNNSRLGISLSSNQITFTELGTYRITGSAPAFFCSQNKAYLFNVTDGVTPQSLTGSSTYSGTGTADTTQSLSLIDGEITITKTTVFELRHYTQIARSPNGLGVASISGGMIEVYSNLTIQKIK